MILHTSSGAIELNPATITDAELAALGLTRAWADKQLAVQLVEQEVAQDNDQALAAYRNWGNLTLAQKERALKMLLGDFVCRNRNHYA